MIRPDDRIGDKTTTPRPARAVPAAPGRARRDLASVGYAEGAARLSPTPKPALEPEGPAAAKTLNMQRAGSEESRQDLPPEVRKRLEARGYILYPVNSLDVLNAKAKENPDAPLSRQKVGSGGYRAVTSGTFYAGQEPVGAIMRDGKLDTPGVDKAKNRGGIAVLQDGSIVVGRMHGNTPKEIQDAFGEKDNPVWDFMGGGALLIEDGRKVTSEDLKNRQRFDQGGGGLDAQQMRKTDHIVAGVREGRFFVIVAKNKTGREIQNDLAGAGFSVVVKLDGGSGAYARDSRGVRTGGQNPTGLGIR